MNNNKEFKILKDNYMNIEIPDNLDKVVNDALNSKSIKTKRKTHIKSYSNGVIQSKKTEISDNSIKCSSRQSTRIA